MSMLEHTHLHGEIGKFRDKIKHDYELIKKAKGLTFSYKQFSDMFVLV
jgi:hypothetical protein